MTAYSLIKSRERVQQFGEVFTPPEIVNKMLNELPTEYFSDFSKKFFEPAAGEGAFVAEIFKRRLHYAKTPQDKLNALKTIYAVKFNATICKF